MIWLAVGGVAGLLVVIAWVVTVADLLGRHMGRGPTAAWLVIVLLLPLLGAILYWTLRKPSEDEIRHQVDAERAVREARAGDSFDSTRIRR